MYKTKYNDSNAIDRMHLVSELTYILVNKSKVNSIDVEMCETNAMFMLKEFAESTKLNLYFDDLVIDTSSDTNLMVVYVDKVSNDFLEFDQDEMYAYLISSIKMHNLTSQNTLLVVLNRSDIPEHQEFKNTVVKCIQSEWILAERASNTSEYDMRKEFNDLLDKHKEETFSKLEKVLK